MPSSPIFQFAIKMCSLLGLTEKQCMNHWSHIQSLIQHHNMYDINCYTFNWNSTGNFALLALMPTGFVTFETKLEPVPPNVMVDTCKDTQCSY